MSSRLNPKPICVRSLVPNEKNSAVFGHLVGQQAGARNLDHRADQVWTSSRLPCDLGLDRSHMASGRFKFLDVAGDRDHDFRGTFLPAFLQFGGRFEDGAHLHLGDFG
jgi:hypothetical protein